MPLALFDFDGTITTEDTYTQFLLSATPKPRLLLGFMLLLPFILLYKLKLFPAYRLRPVLSWFAFAGRKQQVLQQLGKDFADTYLPQVLRPEVMLQIQQHQQSGDKLVLVSASLDVYLEIWCQAHGFELLCSTLEIKKGRATGRYLYGDCYGQNKVKAIAQRYGLSKFDTVYAYGDTPEDKPMLALAKKQFYQGKPVTE